MKDLKFRMIGYAGGVMLAALCLAALSGCTEDRERPMPPKGDGTINMLYVAGTAGAGLNSPKLLVNDDGSFSYKGMLQAGALYFQGAKGSDANVVRQGAGENTIEINGGNDFVITEKGWYDIHISVADMSYEMNHIAFGNTLRLIGPPVDTWDAAYGAYLTCSDSEPFVYTYTHMLFGGEYKFTLQADPEKGVLVPELGGSEIVCFPSQSACEEAGYGPQLWTLPETGEYTFTVDLQNKTVTATPVRFYPDYVTEVYMQKIPDTGLAWTSLEGFPALTRDSANPSVFSITGDFTAGEFYFPLQKHVWRPGIAKDPDGNSLKYDSDGSVIGGSKFSFPSAGNYTVSINVKSNTIDIKKNS